MEKKLLSAILGLLLLASCADTDKARPKKVTAITITPDNLTLTIGQSQAFTATILPAEAANKNVKWTISDDKKATVNASGAVTAVAEGNVTLTATAEDGSNVKGTVDISIKSNEASATAFKLGAENFTIQIPAGETAATLNNAPRTIAGDLTKVPVTLVINGTDATIKTGAGNFTNGSNLDLTKPVTFTLTSKDGIASKNYSLTITAYQAASNPYGVYTPRHLNDMRNGADMNYKLMNNITMPNLDAGAETDVSDYATAGWLPIGHEITFANNSGEITGGFRGTFDGNKNTIDNLYIKRKTAWLGLFGALAKTAIIRNLTVKGRATTSIDGEGGENDLMVGLLAGYSVSGSVVSDCTVSGDIAGKSGTVRMGGMAGRFDGQMTNCTSSVNVVSNSTSLMCLTGGLIGNSASGTVSNCTATGKVTGKGANSTWIGGLIGFSSATISDCSAKGDVSGEGRAWVGGLVGSHSTGAISNCFAEGNVNGKDQVEACNAGGLVGYLVSSATITKCYAAGNVMAESAAESRGASAGGLIGGSNSATVNNCYATGNVQAIAPSGGFRAAASAGLIAGTSGGTISNCYAFGDASVTSGEYGWAGGIISRKEEYAFVETTFTNNYRNSSAAIKKNNTIIAAGDASITGIIAKTKLEMQSDTFTGLLNGTSSVWGWDAAKNNKLPYIKGVGVGK